MTEKIIEDKNDFLNTAESFFNSIFAEAIGRGFGDTEIRIFPKGGYSQNKFFSKTNEAALCAYDLCNSGIDAYFGVNPRVGKRGTKQNVHYVTCFHVEVDYGSDGHKKISEYLNYDDALQAIDSFEPPPTLINSPTTITLPHQRQLHFPIQKRFKKGINASIVPGKQWRMLRVITTDNQVRKLMEEVSKHGKIGFAAMKAGMDRKTGRKYIQEGKLPSELKVSRSWRTRSDPFEKHWPEIERRLKDAPELEAKTIFDHLIEEYPGQYKPGQLRTLQRRVTEWKAREGPEQELFFPQEHLPGEAMQTDFTWATKLGIIISGDPFPHMLCHPVLPFSNWEWATVCRSESLSALKHGVQEALFTLGKVPKFHQTDNSTAATHNLRTGKRGFNDEYAALMRHLKMTPRTIAVGKKEQNGDVEALNGALKRRLKQHLLLRGSSDFKTVDEYKAWLRGVLKKANRLREEKLSKELAVMKSLDVKRLPEYSEKAVGVNIWGTIRVKQNAYSVPSRLKGHQVRVRIYDDRLEVLYKGEKQLTMERLLGKNGHRINYRHVIWSLVRKPGAFRRYKYREDLFPSFTFRRTYDHLSEHFASSRQADIQYLRILHLAASTMESDVEMVLDMLLDQGMIPTKDTVKSLLSNEKPKIPELHIPHVDLNEYDALIESSLLKEGSS